MAEYATRAIGNGALTTGIIGTALGALNTLGGHGGFVNGGATVGDMAQIAQAVAGIANGKCSENTAVTRYDIQNLKELMAKDAEIALLKSEQNTEIKIADVYERLATRMNADKDAQHAWNTQQMVNNAQMTSAITANANSIAGLRAIVGGITRTIVPADAVCPEPMPLKNSWEAPT